jgi:geranylgeranyl pyrophosphate synthase
MVATLLGSLAAAAPARPAGVCAYVNEATRMNVLERVVARLREEDPESRRIAFEFEFARAQGPVLEGGERDKVLDIVRGNGGIDAAVARAGMFVDRAREACGALPAGEVTEAMAEAPAMLLAGIAG